VGISTAFSADIGWIWGLKSNPTAALLTGIKAKQAEIMQEIHSELT